MSWPPPLPIWSEADAIDYAEGCAQRWQVAMTRPHPLPHYVWEALDPPDLFRVPGRFWEVVRTLFRQRCGLDADEAVLQWMAWGACWYRPPRTWIEQVEYDLRKYDAMLRELGEEEG